MVEPDRKYRMMVFLNRTDRPRYWTFHCPICGKPLTEIVNMEVVSINDVVDFARPEMYGTGNMCFSRYCRVWYYFNLSAG